MKVRCLRNILVAVLALAPVAFCQNGVESCTISITGSFPSGTTGQPYSVTLTANMTFSPSPVSSEINTTWSNSGLPPGLSLSPAVISTNVVRQTSFSVSTTISGTPTKGGTFPLTVMVTNSIAVPCTGGQAAYSITIANAPAITTQSPLPPGEVGFPYATTFTAINGGGTYQWSGSAPPAGLMLSSSGVLSGTPTAPGTFPVLVTATVPNVQPPVNLSATFTLTVAPALTIFTGSPLPGGVVGTAYSQTISVSGGYAPYTFALSGTLPSGLTFNAGVLSGTPTALGTASITVQVTDSQNFSVSKQFQLTIAPVPPLLQVSPLALAFSAFVGGSAAPPQTIAIIPTGVSAVGFSITVDNGGSPGTVAPPPPGWITVTPASGTAPAGLTVIANPGSISAGVYPAAIHITIPGNTVQSAITVMVTFTVTAGSPTLGVLPASLSLGALVQSPSTQHPVVLVTNSGGGGALGFSASVVGKSSWITGVSPATANAGPNAPVLVELTINSQGLAVGNYHDILQIASPYGVVDVPVSLFVSADGSIIGLSVNGVRFDERQGHGINRPQVVEVLNRGDLSTPLNPTVDILSGSDWLNIATSGSASRSLVAEILTLTAGGDTTSLPTGGKYALVRVSDPKAQNSPVYLIAVVNVEPIATTASPDPVPAGLFFTPATAAQNVLIYTSSETPAAFQASASTNDGAAWLSVSPATGIASTQTAGSLSVQINPSAVPAAGGIFTGYVNISMGGVLRSVNVTLAAPPPPSGTPFARATSACVPSVLAITQTGLVNNFSVPAGWPASLIVQLNDNCGNPISNGSVIASFSTADPPLPLAGDGATNVYSATWQPGAVVPSMTVTVNAASGTLQPGVAQFVGGVNPNASPAPTLIPNGTLHIFFNVATAAALGGGLAPGNVAQVYGTGLASVAQSPNVVPLVNQFDGTFMLVGSVQVPLFYVSSSLINVQMPVELAPNQYSAIVSANGALTLPETITLVPLQPGMAANPDGTVIAQHVTAGYSLVTAANPAHPGEPIVIYLAGMGATNPVVASGNPTPSQLVPANVQPTVMVDGESVLPGYAGLTPSGVGLYQINFTVPLNARSGNLSLVVMQNGMPANMTTLPVSN
jgi:uncharacterized protein (TIGR03437 family)